MTFQLLFAANYKQYFRIYDHTLNRLSIQRQADFPKCYSDENADKIREAVKKHI